MAQSSVRTLRQKTVPLRPDSRQARIQQIEDYWRQFPGAAPGGTGSTGLLSNDAQGYSRLLNEQTEHANLLRELDDKGPLAVKFDPSPGDDASGTAGDALADVAASMPYYVPPAPPVEGKAPTAPPGPPAPPAPPLPPPTGPRSSLSPRAPGPSSAALGTLAAQTGARPGLVTRYRSAPGSRRVALDPNNPTAITDVDTPNGEDAAAMMRNLRMRTATA